MLIDPWRIWCEDSLRSLSKTDPEIRDDWKCREKITFTDTILLYYRHLISNNTNIQIMTLVFLVLPYQILARSLSSQSDTLYIYIYTEYIVRAYTVYMLRPNREMWPLPLTASHYEQWPGILANVRNIQKNQEFWRAIIATFSVAYNHPSFAGPLILKRLIL